MFNFFPLLLLFLFLSTFSTSRSRCPTKPSEIYRVASLILQIRRGHSRTFISREAIRVIVRGRRSENPTYHGTKLHLFSLRIEDPLIFHEYDFQTINFIRNKSTMTVERWPVHNHRVSDVRTLRGSFAHTKEKLLEIDYFVLAGKVRKDLKILMIRFRSIFVGIIDIFAIHKFIII